jgi:hypothetical protein
MALTKVRTGGLTDDAVTTDKLYTPNLGRRNLIINGAMQVAQRGTSVSSLNSDGYHTLDRWKMAFNTSGDITMSQDSSDTPNGFGSALKISTTTADTSIAAGEYLLLQCLNEGQNLQSIKKGTADAETLTLSFYVKGNANATYAVELADDDNGRKVSKTFSVTSSWNRVVLTFPADATGELTNDNNNSLVVRFFLHAGSDYTSGTLNSNWSGSPASGSRAAGIDSILDSTSRTFHLTGVQLEVGEQATPFEHRSFGEEENLCRRFYQRTGGIAYYPWSIVSGQNSTLSRSIQPLITPMRATPSFSTEGTHLVEGTSSQTVSSTSIDIATPTTVMINVNSSSGHGEDGSAGRWLAHNTTGAYIIFDAEL